LPELIFDICHEEDRSIAGQFAMLLWTVWNNRNDQVWNNKQEPGRNLGFKSMQYWCDWYALQQQNYTSEQQQQVIAWQEPPLNWHKYITL
jgi:hypothetical protein